MTLGAVLEPGLVVSLLATGVLLNRRRAPIPRRPNPDEEDPSPPGTPGSDAPLLDSLPWGKDEAPSTASISRTEIANKRREGWRPRTLKAGPWRRTVWTPDTAVYKNRWFSRVVAQFPFLVEALYWALLYWVYQLGRAFTAVTLLQSTVSVARRHALQVIRTERALHIFWELDIQAWFLARPSLLKIINNIYSFVHIPGTIAFLVWLYWYTDAAPHLRTRSRNSKPGERSSPARSPTRALADQAIYHARRRTMAMCNLLAFVVFTLWPCMPPRLLSDSTLKDADTPAGLSGQGFGFVDTVHGKGSVASVWTQNKFCNQYAAMPSLHFGYSLLIGASIATVPVRGAAGAPEWVFSLHGVQYRLRVPGWNWRRLGCVGVGVLYPLTILVAIVATANHFLLDAVAGAGVCGLAWWGNEGMVNLRPVEDWALWCVGLHFPEGEDEREEV
ncbi:hypothetical protein EJ06DRAFT_479620 [Trichodelitschia bisporula]|uniref:Inositolphosphotransferase Aur1/Ipt1 domain-containing protein n=1 Tax=Trichodelitschia bisporula TaxID=703511 RepID=A0A6G1HSG6_9PEZI|nr:hypothetical protein EJ06DRAFT_479620 [Trichodelitschia bisporula]